LRQIPRQYRVNTASIPRQYRVALYPPYPKGYSATHQRPIDAGASHSASKWKAEAESDAPCPLEK
jgi:hypothetical protein